jgi:hypothetical protein
VTHVAQLPERRAPKQLLKCADRANPCQRRQRIVREERRLVIRDVHANTGRECVQIAKSRRTSPHLST